jgi:hypothetical protein
MYVDRYPETSYNTNHISKWNTKLEIEKLKIYIFRKLIVSKSFSISRNIKKFIVYFENHQTHTHIRKVNYIYTNKLCNIYINTPFFQPCSPFCFLVKIILHLKNKQNRIIEFRLFFTRILFKEQWKLQA